MAKQLGPIDVECDAPPYSIVQACHMIGLESPEDVRWCRLSHHRGGNRHDVLGFQPWKIFAGQVPVDERKCVCGQLLPRLEEYTFTFITGDEACYQIGQCRKCRSIYWE
jgi:hypothetical protein